jgi:hypothetical protein
MLAEKQGTEVTRPLRVLGPLIKEAISRGDRAGREHYCRAGEMLLEARRQVEPGHWTAWVKDHCAISPRTADAYMQLARKIAEDRGFPGTLSDAAYPHKKGAVRPPEWHADVHERLGAVDVERLRQDRQNQEKERRLMHQLAWQLIDIGYKVLATKLHPDKGGSKEAMARLNRVRDQLKAALKAHEV